MPSREIERSPFGKRLVQARKHAKLTQEAAAKAAEMSQGTLAELERTGSGSSYTPQLAHIYQCSATWLATGKGENGLARNADGAPPPPPGDFRDPKHVSPSGWQLLEDLVWIVPEERETLMAEIHEKAERQRRHLNDTIKRLKKQDSG